MCSTFHFLLRTWLKHSLNTDLEVLLQPFLHAIVYCTTTTTQIRNRILQTQWFPPLYQNEDKHLTLAMKNIRNMAPTCLSVAILQLSTSQPMLTGCLLDTCQSPCPNEAYRLVYPTTPATLPQAWIQHSSRWYQQAHWQKGCFFFPAFLIYRPTTPSSTCLHCSSCSLSFTPRSAMSPPTAGSYCDLIICIQEIYAEYMQKCI